MTIHRTAAVSLLLTIAPLAGCGSSTPAGGVSTPAAPEFDLPTIMEGIAATLRDERAVLVEAIDDWESIDAADHRALRAAREERIRLGAEYIAMLKAYPSWSESACGWFESVVLPAHLEVLGTQRRLRALPVPGGERDRYLEVLLGAFETKEAARANLGWSLNDPGAPTNMYILCIKQGFATEE